MEQLVRIRIGGMTYTLKASEDEAYMREIAEEADQMIEAILKDHPHLNRAAAPILALVNALDAREKLKEQCRDFLLMREEVVQALKDLDAERLSLREQNWEMKKELLYFKNLCEAYEERLAGSEISLPHPPKPASTSKRKTRPLDRTQLSLSDLQAELKEQEP